MTSCRTPGPYFSPFVDPIDGGTMCLVEYRGPSEFTAVPAVADPVESLPPARLEMSVRGGKLLKELEATRLKPYDDQTGKDITAWTRGATIGIGHLIPSGEWGTYKNGIKQERADELFDEDLRGFVASVRARVKVPLKVNQFDALCILAYNLPPSTFAHSSALRLVNDPTVHTNYPDLEAAWKAFNRSQGKVNTGLQHRREIEWNVFSRAIYNRALSKQAATGK